MNGMEGKTREELIAHIDEMHEGLRRIYWRLTWTLEQAERRSKRIEAELRRSGLLR